MNPGIGPPGQALCASGDLAERGRAWVWEVLANGQPARAFVLRFDGVLRAFLNRCVHVPAEMDWRRLCCSSLVRLVLTTTAMEV